MARRNISIPDELEAEMAKFGRENWSAVCREAITGRIRNLEAMENKTMDAIERLKASKEEWMAQLSEQGKKYGIDWATRCADYGELRLIATVDLDGEFRWQAPLSADEVISTIYDTD